MTRRQLHVRINQQAIGILSTQDDIWRFAYDAQWLQHAEAFALSPALPLSNTEYVDGQDVRSVQWYFDNLLPEEQLRMVLAKEARIDHADAFGLLAYFGAESAGSLILEQSRSLQDEEGLVALPLEELNQRIQNLPHASLTQASPKRMSLAGAQHKMVLVLRDGKLYEPLAGMPSTHILKPNSQSADYPHSVINEYFCMRLAAALTVTVPHVQRLYAPAPAYIVERFDRKIDLDARITRLHIIDTCQLLNRSRVFKYEQATLDTLVQAIDQCTAKAAARLQLFRWLLFNYFIGNADNHLKNISFHIGPEGIRLAPAYDLLSTAVYDIPAFHQQPTWPNVSLALSLHEAHRFSQVTREVLLQTGKTLGLSLSTVRRELEKMENDLPIKADALLQEIEAYYPVLIEASPSPEQAVLHQAGELRLLRSIRHGILADTLRMIRAA